jgi:hypothetical protein
MPVCTDNIFTNSGLFFVQLSEFIKELTCLPTTAKATISRILKERNFQDLLLRVLKNNLFGWLVSWSIGSLLHITGPKSEIVTQKLHNQR